ncbi:MAG TPA: hypothetical protein VMF89_23375 [Polyangiales bacterium]|nr:hypothetical protein [Polyangiales bacterium]
MNAAPRTSVSFGTRLRALRARRGLSSDAVDETLGLEHGTSARWEDELDPPAVAHDLSILLADYFCVTLDQLLRGAPLSREPAFPPALHQFVASPDGQRALQLNLIRALRYLPCLPSIELYREVVAVLEPYADASDAIRSEHAAPLAMHKLVATADGRLAMRLNLINMLLHMPTVPTLERYREIIATIVPFVQAIDVERAASPMGALCS